MSASGRAGDSPTRSVEWLLSALMVAWGAGLALPGDSLQQPGLQYLAACMSEDAWAMVAIGTGSARMLALWINGRWRRSPLVRVAGSGAGVAWWAGLGWLYWAGSLAPYPASLFYYPVLVAFEAYSVVRSAADATRSRALAWRPHPGA